MKYIYTSLFLLIFPIIYAADDYLQALETVKFLTKEGVSKFSEANSKVDNYKKQIAYDDINPFEKDIEYINRYNKYAHQFDSVFDNAMGHGNEIVKTLTDSFYQIALPDLILLDFNPINFDSEKNIWKINGTFCYRIGDGNKDTFAFDALLNLTSNQAASLSNANNRKITGYVRISPIFGVLPAFILIEDISLNKKYLLNIPSIIAYPGFDIVAKTNWSMPLQGLHNNYVLNLLDSTWNELPIRPHSVGFSYDETLIAIKDNSHGSNIDGKIVYVFQTYPTFKEVIHFDYDGCGGNGSFKFDRSNRFLLMRMESEGCSAQYYVYDLKLKRINPADLGMINSINDSTYKQHKYNVILRENRDPINQKRTQVMEVSEETKQIEVIFPDRITVPDRISVYSNFNRFFTIDSEMLFMDESGYAEQNISKDIHKQLFVIPYSFYFSDTTIIREIAITTPISLGDMDESHLCFTQGVVIDTQLSIVYPERTIIRFKSSKGNQFDIDGEYNDLVRLGFIQKVKVSFGGSLVDDFILNPKMIKRTLSLSYYNKIFAHKTVFGDNELRFRKKIDSVVILK